MVRPDVSTGSATRIGIMGGSFDPPHNGHIAIARSFLESDLIDELWILPAPDPPHKRDQTLSAFSVRYKLAELAFSELKLVRVLAVEDQLPKPSYSVRTVNYLQNAHPQADFYLCIGSDSALQFHRWFRFEQILDMVGLLVAARPGFDIQDLDPRVSAKVTLVNHEPTGESSTEIRERC